MASRRQAEVAQLVRDELSVLIARRVSDPRVHTLTSVTAVEVSPDLRHARVFISVLGSEEEQKHTMGALRSAVGFLRRELAGRVSLRHVPELDFRLDKSIERGERIMDLLRKLEQEASKNGKAKGEAAEGEAT